MILFVMGFPGGLVVKESALNAGDPGSIPGLDFTVFNPKYIVVDSSGMRQKSFMQWNQRDFSQRE